VGLIGGSLALALKEAGKVATVGGTGRNKANLELAASLGIVDEWTTSLLDAVSNADLIVLAVPMGAYAAVLSEIAPVLKQGAVVTDAGSTKQHALKTAQSLLPNHVSFVAAHPLAGTEKSGAGAAFASLYQDHLCILTPDQHTNGQALSLVQTMWEDVGAKVIEMKATEHDALLASVSHLPHLAAFAIVNAVRGQETGAYDPFSFAAGGFRDFTRIASSSPTMWRDIALANREALVKQVDGLQCELSKMKEALLEDDGEALLCMFASAKESRDAWLAAKGEVES